ncbi:MAG: hypothetical protein E7559_02895 [Ruminococcaceae bacterium]|nr:hypothetical protein [Oscillospiraceae bacterium]
MKKNAARYTVMQRKGLQWLCVFGAALFMGIYVLFLRTANLPPVTQWSGNDWSLSGCFFAFIALFLVVLWFIRRPRVRVSGRRIFFYPRFGFMRETDADTLREKAEIRRKRSAILEPVGSLNPPPGEIYDNCRFFYPERISYYIDGRLVLRYSTLMRNHELLTLLLAPEKDKLPEVTAENVTVCPLCGAKYLDEGNGCPACGIKYFYVID